MSRLTRWKSPPQPTDSSASEYRYSPLIIAKTGIRLAILQPGTGNKAISIHLVDSHVKGPGRLDYVALSYVWSTSNRDKVISCNGRRLYVTKTLLEAMSRFRQKDEPVTLWIDQICICQDRMLERNAQVQMMGEIFRSARKVVVWLGDDYDDSKAGMQLAQQLLHVANHRQVENITTADLEVHGLPKQNSKKWKALAAILRRPWFWRTWIVQEVVLNVNVDLVLGARSLSWEELGKIVALLEGPLPRLFHLEQAVTAFELPFTKIDRIRKRHQGRMPESRPVSRMAFLEDNILIDEPDDMTPAEDPELLDLLLQSRSLGATDPRDKIYALLGIGKHSIETDYSLSPESLYHDFALSIIGEVTQLAAARAKQGLEVTADDREVRKAMLLLSCAGKQNQTLSIPSWVPDWTTDILSRPLIFDSQFRAGGDQIGVFDWSPDAGLHFSGMLFDTIQTAGVVRLDWQGGDITTNDHDLIKRWTTEAVEMATTRNVCSPGSIFNLDAFTNMRRSLSLCKHGYYTGSENGRRRQSLLDEGDLVLDAKHSALHTMTLGPTRGRVFITTAMGHVGLAPYGTQEGDVIFVVLGGNVPLLFRHSDDAFELIGEVYVQGIMYGEALAMDHALGIQDIRVR